MTFVCPRCKGPLLTQENAYTCEACNATYPVVMGIPDFRVFDDPWIEKEDDYAKAARIVSSPITTGPDVCMDTPAPPALIAGIERCGPRRSRDSV